jgi:hypothetical protein
MEAIVRGSPRDRPAAPSARFHSFPVEKIDPCAPSLSSSFTYLSMNSAAQKELAFADYWNKRYADDRAGKADEDGDDYEWFKTYEKLKPFLSKHLPPVQHTPKILQLGCGTSVCEPLNDIR